MLSMVYLTLAVLSDLILAKIISMLEMVSAPNLGKKRIANFIRQQVLSFFDLMLFKLLIFQLLCALNEIRECHNYLM